MIATVTSKGQVTLPKEFRDELGLKAGDKIAFKKDEFSKIYVEKVPPKTST